MFVSFQTHTNNCRSTFVMVLNEGQGTISAAEVRATDLNISSSTEEQKTIRNRVRVSIILNCWLA